MERGPLNEFIENLGKWQEFAALYLKPYIWTPKNGINVSTIDHFTQTVTVDGYQLEIYRLIIGADKSLK